MRVVARCVLSLFLLLPAAVLADVAPPPPSFKLEGSRLLTPSPITFKAGTDTLTDESLPALEHVRAYLDAKSYISTLRIESHSSEPGAASQTLSERRALAIARWLVEKGVDCKRLIAVGFGDTKPVADNATPEGKAQNQRISFENAGLRGRAIGGMPLDGGGKVAGDPCAKK
jgi:OOP family OmpA-OmpF porin